MSVTTTSHTTTIASGPIVLVGSENGITVIPTETPLARLNYFDGKFLRADDLTAEQRYLRSLVELSNRAGGHGVVHGFDVSRRGSGELEISPGLAVDPQGRVLLLPVGTAVSLAELIEKSRKPQASATTAAGFAAGTFGPCELSAETPPGQVVEAGDLYVITVAHAEALCGEEDVYGRLCEKACATSSDRPIRYEGVILRARPLLLTVPLPTSGIPLTLTHWRSRVASSHFEEERRRVGSLISKEGLESDAWCHGAVPATGTEVPLAVVGRVGAGIHFLDEWIVRRERMATSPQRYWQWRMAMRPWDVFLAQVLQFQCQLNGLFRAGGGGVAEDPCRDAKALVEEASRQFDAVKAFYAETTQRLMKLSRSVRDRAFSDAASTKETLARLETLGQRLSKATAAYQALPADRLLIRGGIVELPSAGYLPVIPGSTVTVNQQVRRLMGEGVDLRFCIVRPDYVAHALEEAQHLERISLLTGIDNPARKQQVDILVPDGQIAPDRVEQGRFYEMRLNVNIENLTVLAMALSGLQAGRYRAAADRAMVALRADMKDTGEVMTVAAQDPQWVLLRRYLQALEQDERAPLVLEYPTGAARAEEGADGAYSFCYAGSTGALRWVGAGETGVAVADLADANRLYARIASNPVGLFAKKTRATATAETRGTSRIDVRSSIWIALEIGGDPLRLPERASVPIRAECYLLLSAHVKDGAQGRRIGGEGLLHLSFIGDLQVEDSDVRAGKSEVREVKAALSGQLSYSTVDTDGDRDAGSLHLTEAVTILRMEAAYGPSFRIEAAEPSILAPLVAALGFRREWTSATESESVGTMSFRTLKDRTALAGYEGGNYTHAVAAVMAKPGAAAMGALAEALTGGRPVVRQAFRAWQSIRPEVLVPTHPAHESAIRALRGIGAALGSGKFADLAAKRLFPAPATRAEGINVLATRDWVLFHRRRERQCVVLREAPVVETRTYALYWVRLKGDLQVADLARAMARGGSELARFEPDYGQILEFGAGIHAVVTPHTLVQAGWRQEVGADAGVIAGGVIASRGLAAAEGERLAEDRIEALVEVLAPVTPPVPKPVYVVQNRIPDGYGAVGNDGMVVIATREVVKGVCHVVHAFMGTMDHFGSFTGLAIQAGLPTALKEFGERLLPVQVGFDRPGGTLDPAGKEALAKTFKASWRRGEWIGFVADESEIPAGTRETQQVLEVVGADPQGGKVLVGKEFTAATDCHGITVVRVEEVQQPPQTMQHVIRIAINADNALGTITASAGTTGFPEVLAKYSNLVGEAEFDVATNQLVGDGLDKAFEDWKATGPSASPSAGYVLYQAGDASAPGYEVQGRMVAERFGTGQWGGGVAVSGAYPAGAPAITLLIPALG